MKRHTNAIYISDGACNVSGIAYSLIEACQEIRANPTTGCIETDPAVALMVSQIAYLVGLWDGISDWNATSWTWDYAREACQRINAQDARQTELAL